MKFCFDVQKPLKFSVFTNVSFYTDDTLFKINLHVQLTLVPPCSFLSSYQSALVSWSALLFVTWPVHIPNSCLKTILHQQLYTSARITVFYHHPSFIKLWLFVAISFLYHSSKKFFILLSFQMKFIITFSCSKTKTLCILKLFQT